MIALFLERVPGIVLAFAIALAAIALGALTGLPVAILAVFAGVMLSSLSLNPYFRTGLDFTTRRILRMGVALLGFHLIWDDVVALGWPAIVMIVLALFVTIAAGIVFARMLKLPAEYGALSGGAFAICGVSAAMAISAVLPEYKHKERDLGVTVVSVTCFSTIGVLLYPLIGHVLGLDGPHMAMFLGGVIHDVGQTVAAGYAISDKVGHLAVLTKMIRVAFLLPVVLGIMAYFIRQARKHSMEQETPKVPVPLFLFFFAGFMFANSVIDIPQDITDTIGMISKYMLMTAVAAAGLKTHFSQILEVGHKGLLLMTLEVITLVAVVLSCVYFL